VRAATKDQPGTAKAKSKAKATKSPSSPPTLHAAASSTVTISDFKFAPKSITVKVGDTVTWSNQGPTGHSATANDGTFDTGLLTKGSTGQFRFTKAGTFNYHCTPHPYMTAKVIVTGTSTSTAGSGSGGTSAGSGSGSSGSGSSSSGSSLPHTGFEIASLILAGLTLLSAGAALRRLSRLTRT
jgi:LPXTG-motif cell wall-anchored protein